MTAPFKLAAKEAAAEASEAAAKSLFKEADEVAVRRLEEMVGKDVAAENPLRIGQGLSAEANVTLTSRIGESSYAVRQAEGLSIAAQRDVDNILSQLSK